MIPPYILNLVMEVSWANEQKGREIFVGIEQLCILVVNRVIHVLKIA